MGGSESPGRESKGIFWCLPVCLRRSDAPGASAAMKDANSRAQSLSRCLTLFFFTHLKHNGHFVFITAVQLNLCKSCPLIQLIDFAVISHSLQLSPCILSADSLLPLSGLLMAAGWS